MAKQRMINTRFWDDGYIVTLDPIEKLLFIYLLTNPLTEIAGAYEIPLRRIAFDTGIDSDMVLKIIARFADADKIIYRDGWILICNFIKHQAKNPNVEKGIENSLSRCPDWIKDRLYIAYESLSHLNLNLNSNLNLNLNSNDACASDPNGDESAFVNDLLDGIRGRLNLNILRDETGWCDTAIFARTNNFSITQLLECFDLLRLQKWRTGPVTAKTVADNITNLDKLRTEIKEQQNGNRQPTEREKSANRRINAERMAVAIETGDEAALRQILGNDDAGNIKGYLPV